MLNINDVKENMLNSSDVKKENVWKNNSNVQKQCKELQWCGGNQRGAIQKLCPFSGIKNSDTMDSNDTDKIDMINNNVKNTIDVKEMKLVALAAI